MCVQPQMVTTETAAPRAHIVIARAPGYSKVIKKVIIPSRMKRAGRVTSFSSR